MGINERRQRQMDELRQQIINQSWTIIINEGWQALSIRKIAEAIEYSVPVIYKHFENKEAIIEHFSREGFALLANQLQQVADQPATPSVRLLALAEAYWNFAATYNAHYRIMFGLGIPPCETINSNTEMKSTSNHMLETIEAIIIASENTIADKYLKLKTFWSTLHGFIAIELLSESHLSAKPSLLVQDAVESFIFSLKNNK